MEVVTEEKITTEETATPIVEEKKETTAERLARLTEKKPEPENKKVDTSFFGSDEDFEKTEETKSESTEEKKKEEKSEEKKSAGDIKLTEQAMEASAETAVGMLDMTMQTVLTPIHGWKFKKKFKKEDILKLEDLVDAELDKIEDELDLKLRKKWDRLFKKFEKKKDAVAMTEPEKKSLKDNFVSYFKHTGKSLPPEYLIYMGLANVVGKRVVDLVVE